MLLAVSVSALCAGFTGTVTARTIQDMDGALTPERPAATRLSQNLPSELEQRLGIRPNSANPEYRRGRGVPSDFEQRRGYRRGYGDGYGGGYRGEGAERCEGLAYRRGLVGREFRRFVRYCMER
jgi:hypothetical protein